MVPACTWRSASASSSGKRRQRPRGDDVGRERRHLLDARRMHRHGHTAGARRLAQERRLALVALDQVRRPARPSTPGQARQPGAAAEIGQYLRTRRPEAPELAAVEDVAAPGIGQRGGADQVDPRLPARQQVEIGLQPVQCFT